MSYLDRACKSIEEHVPMCASHAQEKGCGISLFLFQALEEDKGLARCDYFFHKKDSGGWNVFKSWIPKEFTREDQFLIIVAVPDGEKRQCRAVLLEHIPQTLIDEEIEVEKSNVIRRNV